MLYKGSANKQNCLYTRFIKTLRKLEYTVNIRYIIYSRYILVLEYIKTRTYGKYTEFFESRFKILRFIKDFQLRLQDLLLLTP